MRFSYFAISLSHISPHSITLRHYDSPLLADFDFLLMIYHVFIFSG